MIGKKRRSLRSTGEGPFEEFLHQLRGGRDEGPGSSRLEILMLSFMLFFVLAMGIASVTGNLSAALVGMVALVFLVMAFMLVTSNYLIATGKFTQKTIIYWYMAAVGIGLLVAYAVARGVLPLVLQGVVPSQFEFLLSWALWFIPIVLIIGILIMGLAAPSRRT